MKINKPLPKVESASVIESRTGKLTLMICTKNEVLTIDPRRVLKAVNEGHIKTDYHMKPSA